MVDISWEAVSEHLDKGDLKEWLKEERTIDKARQLSRETDTPRGEWIDTGNDPSHSHPLTAIWYRCSECGDGTNTKTNYCPNCGAKMKQ